MCWGFFCRVCELVSFEQNFVTAQRKSVSANLNGDTQGSKQGFLCSRQESLICVSICLCVCVQSTLSPLVGSAVYWVHFLSQVCLTGHRSVIGPLWSTDRLSYRWTDNAGVTSMWQWKKCSQIRRRGLIQAESEMCRLSSFQSLVPPISHVVVYHVFVVPLLPSLSLSHTPRSTHIPAANVIFRDFSPPLLSQQGIMQHTKNVCLLPTHTQTHTPCPSCQSSWRKSVPTLSLNCVPFDAWLAWKWLWVKLNIFNATSPHHHTHTHSHTPLLTPVLLSLPPL